MAAQREGMKIVIFPRSNKDDVEELPDYIKQGLTIHYAENYIDVFKICFPDVKIVPDTLKYLA
jgi:ATP-dependent Lon protease